MKFRGLALILVICLLISCCGCGLTINITPETPSTTPTTPSNPTDPTDPTDPSDPSDPTAPIDPPEEKPAGEETALTINGHNVSHFQLNYFYVDAIDEFCNEYGSWISYVLSTTTPLSDQIYDDEVGTTWADYFLKTAMSNAKNAYALYDAAIAAGHTLTEDEQALIETLRERIDEYAKHYEFKDADEYLKVIYGEYSNFESYMIYYELLVTISSYFSAYAEGLLNSYTEPMLREYEADRTYEYNSYSYATYYLSPSYFTDDSFTAEDAAKQLASGDNNTIEKLNAAIAALEKKLDDSKTTFSTATVHTETLYNGIDIQLQEWIRDLSRQIGDIAYLTYTSEGGYFAPAEEGYYVILFTGVHDNQFPLANVRHILAIFDGSTEEDMKKAKEEAEKIYAEWLAGEQTEESFAELAKKYTDDSNGDVGGLYEDVYPGQMVQTFNDWCFDPSRAPGDHNIVETEYGYHIMFYSGDSDTTFRDFMVSSDKQYDDLSAWQTALLDAATLEIVDTSSVNMDYIING